MNATMQSLDVGPLRASLKRAVASAKPRLHGRLMDLGCGKMPYRELLLAEPSLVTEYVGVDIPSPLYPFGGDVEWDGQSLPFEASSFDSIIATEVFEHCVDLPHTLSELHRVLKPDGVLFFTTPFIWPIHDAPNDYCRWSPYGLERALAASSFESETISPLGGWNASLAQVIGLWVRRRPMPAGRRRLLTAFVSPLIRYLLSRDTITQPFEQGLLFTGVHGLARAIKPVEGTIG